MKKKKQPDVESTKQYPSLFRRLAAWLYDTLVIAAVLMLAGGIAIGLMAALVAVGMVDITGYEDVSAT